MPVKSYRLQRKSGLVVSVSCIQLTALLVGYLACCLAALVCHKDKGRNAEGVEKYSCPVFSGTTGLIATRDLKWPEKGMGRSKGV
jgi:hypothetical protein